MTESLRKYLELEASLLVWRAGHPDDTPEEDAILDEMDGAWWDLSQEEREWIRRRGRTDSPDAHRSD
jgi:hypothetical protein